VANCTVSFSDVIFCRRQRLLDLLDFKQIHQYFLQ